MEGYIRPKSGQALLGSPFGIIIIMIPAYVDPVYLDTGYINKCTLDLFILKKYTFKLSVIKSK